MGGRRSTASSSARRASACCRSSTRAPSSWSASGATSRAPSRGRCRRGAMQPGESEEAAVQRELGEEAGYAAARLVKLASIATSKSVLDETAHLYLAEGLRPAPSAPDHTEFIEVRAFPFDEVLRMVERSEITDAMTVVAVLHAVRRRSAP